MATKRKLARPKSPVLEMVDVRRLRREYGAAVADEVLRQLVSVRSRTQPRGGGRRTR
jgi:hypothetical protein